MPIFTLAACLDPRHVADILATEKTAALNELVGLVAGAPQIGDQEVFRNSILDREKVLSTGIGLGLALPHVNIPEVVGFIAALGRSRAGIEFDSIDEKPVHLMLMIAAPQKQHRDFLKVIAHVSKLLRDQALRDALLAAPTPTALHSTLIEAEKKFLGS